MVKITQATAGDAEVVAVLIGEIEEYYGGDRIPGDLAQVRAALFGERPMATVLLARDGEAVLGMASYSFLWPAARASASLYLKELFVREGVRRRGVAGALMTRLQALAGEAGCSRVEWTADRDNPSALAFYEGLGVVPEDGKVFYRVNRESV
jgi:GNAT superfamily N-acetyltransferase